MGREPDAKWFQHHREALAGQYAGRWLVVYDGKLDKVFADEAEAVEYAVTTHGINAASVFRAIARDPFDFIGSQVAP